MTELVLDASVIVKWFRQEGESHVAEALALRASALRGELLLVVPVLLFLELLNTAARSWRWAPAQLDAMAAELERLPFVIQTPALTSIAHWCGQGLTAYDACYVALAAERRSTLITVDEQVLAVAGGLARRLAGRR